MRSADALLSLTIQRIITTFGCSCTKCFKSLAGDVPILRSLCLKKTTYLTIKVVAAYSSTDRTLMVHNMTNMLSGVMASKARRAHTRMPKMENFPTIRLSTAELTQLCVSLARCLGEQVHK